ncbi:helix-turn-helix domain-containing protein [Raoultella ornithinolytica]|uniref:helix-turn-helix domain-containing protein n=1 Tax=Raoultella ornithinolytica TaxID=54291 RepID=UPI00225AFF59|nr:helix-turn-helix domain-containing protein [Raoultella ornithinolytica]MCX3409258.1 helix-turn-helix domain-containing protein [Raoultella ornithinolytica]
MVSRFGNIHTFYQSLELTSHLPEVIACGEDLELASGERFQPAEGFIYFLRQGQVTLAVDDEQNLLGIVIENMPLGLLEHYCPSARFFYRCQENCRFSKIAASDFERIFYHSSPQYMKELTTILVYMGIFVLDVSNERGNLSGFQTIKSMLFRYLYRREIDTGKRESLSAFIIKRTNLSRSYVYQVLAALKEGGYITVKKGQLISIDRKIPEKF